MKNKISDVRDHLFATIEALLDLDNPMEVQRARAVAEAASVIIESAKVEVAMLRLLEQAGAPNLSTTGFIEGGVEAPPNAGHGQRREPQSDQSTKTSVLHPWRKPWTKSRNSASR